MVLRVFRPLTVNDFEWSTRSAMDERREDEDEEWGALSEGHGVRRRTGRIAFARIEPRTLHGHLPEELRRALEPGSAVEHYQRRWILGQISEIDGVITGKLGFESRATGSRFDAELRDFVVDDHEVGTYSVFAISLEQMRVAFQTHGAVIKPQSFAGALQALLNQTTPTERWRVEREQTELSWEQWIARARRIDRVRVKVERPNPNYHGRRRVEGLVEGLNAEIAELAARADPEDPQGLDRHDSLLEELIGHAESYGSVEAQGSDDAGASIRFSSGPRAEEVEVEVDPETRDVSVEELRRHLES